MKGQARIGGPTEYAGVRFAIDDANVDQGIFTGYASVFGSRVNAWIPTVIEKGAFTKTLKENSERVKILYQHYTDQLLGKPTKMEEDSKGLNVEGKISLTALGRDVIVLMKDGVLDELSIGFDPMKWSMDEPTTEGEDALRHIQELRLWEFSPVTFAADPNAKIASVHAVAVRNAAALVETLKRGTQGKATLEAADQAVLRELHTALQTFLDSEPTAEERALARLRGALRGEQLQALDDVERAVFVTIADQLQRVLARPEPPAAAALSQKAHVDAMLRDLQLAGLEAGITA